MAHAKASFEITAWDDAPWDDSCAVALSRATVRKTFTGDLEGESVAELLTVTVDGNPVEYRAIERVDGALGGRRGTFVVSHGAGPESGGTAAAVKVVPGSGTGALAGLRGEGTVSHGALQLDYEIE